MIGRTRALVVAVAACALLSAVAAGTVSGLSAPASSSPAGPTSPSAPTASVGLSVSPATTPPIPPTVAATLDLTNDTWHAGNYHPAVGVGPYTDVYDPAKHEVFVADLNTANLTVISTVSDRVVASIPMIGVASFVAYDPAMGEIFVSNYVYGTVSVINDTTDHVVAVISVTGQPYGIAYDSHAQRVFVASTSLTCFSCQGTVSVIDPSTNSVSKTLGVGDIPYGVVYDNGTDQVFVVNAASDNVSVIDGSSDRVVANVTVGDLPVCPAYYAPLGEVFVSNEGSNTTSVISDSSDSVVATIPVGSSPGGIESDPTDQEVFVSNYYDGNVSVVDANSNSVVGTVAVGLYPWGGAYDRATGQIFLTVTGTNSVVLIDAPAAADIATIAIGAEPSAVVYDPAKGELFVAGSSNVTILSGPDDTVTDSVPIPSGNLVAAAYGLGQVFVASGGGDSVTAINDTTDLPSAPIPVGMYPSALAYDSQHEELFVADESTANVTVLSAAHLHPVANISVGGAPAGVAYVRSLGEVFVTNLVSDRVSVINDTTNSVVATIPVGGQPVGIAYDSGTGELFVAVESSPTVPSAFVAVINAASRTVVTGIYPCNLVCDIHPSAQAVAYDPADRAVWVTVISGVVYEISDRTDRVTHSVGVGSTPLGVVYDAGAHSVVVANTFQGTLSFLYPDAEPLTFRAVGLPADSSWGVAAGAPSVSRTNTTVGGSGALSFPEPNGTVPFTVTPPAGYGVSKVTGPRHPLLGVASVSGPTTVVVHFAPLETLYFNETGLPDGSLWAVNISSTVAYGEVATHSSSSTTSSIGFTVPAGHYQFDVTGKPAMYRAAPHRGSVSVGDRSKTKAIRFSTVSVRVRFVEHGLRPGTEWGVNLTGAATEALTARAPAAISVELLNGTYDWSAWNFTVLHPTPAHGSEVIVAPGRSVTQSVAYAAAPLHALEPRPPSEVRVGSPAAPSALLAPNRD